MTFAATLLPITDALIELIELPDDMTADTSGAAPAKYAPDVLYVWPRTQRFVTEGDGSLDLGMFRVRCAWARSGQREETGQLRLRAVSDELDEGVQIVADMVRANRTSATWEQLEVEDVTYDAVVTFEVRAAWIDIAGYRLLQ